MRIRLFLSVMLAAGAMALVLSPVTEGQRTTHLNRVVDVLARGGVSIGFPPAVAAISTVSPTPGMPVAESRTSTSCS